MSAQIVRFPKLLWSIIHSDKSGAIEWSPDGLKVVLNPEIFEEKYLKTGVFKTNRMSSFIRNLHLYGFLIVPNVLEELNGQKLRLYRHPNFVRGQPELIDQIQRHGAREDRLRAKQSQFRPHQSSTTPRSPATPEPLRSTVSLKPTDGSQLLKVGLQLVPAILRIQLGPNATVSQTVVEPARQEEEVEPFDDLLQLPLYTDDFRASQDWNSQSGRIFQSALFPQSCTDEMAVLAYLRLL